MGITPIGKVGGTSSCEGLGYLPIGKDGGILHQQDGGTPPPAVVNRLKILPSHILRMRVITKIALQLQISILKCPYEMVKSV